MSPSNWELLYLLAATLAMTSSGTYVMTEGFAQYLLDTGRLTKRYTGTLESGRSYLLPIDVKPPLLVKLRSLQGDVDLYVSGSGRTPSPVDFDLKSENFSVDLVFVPEELKQTISALIYASPQCSDNASYVLEIYRHDSFLDEYSAIRDELEASWEAPDENFAQSSSARSGSYRSSSGHSASRSSSSSSDSESAGSFLYNLVVQLGRLLLFILEVAAD